MEVNIKRRPKRPPLNELTKSLYHSQAKMSTDEINKIFFDNLYILRIDICPRLVYTVVRKKTKDNQKPWSSREWKGTDSDENWIWATRTFGKIYEEGNESKEQVSSELKTNFWKEPNSNVQLKRKSKIDFCREPTKGTKSDVQLKIKLKPKNSKGMSPKNSWVKNLIQIFKKGMSPKNS